MDFYLLEAGEIRITLLKHLDHLLINAPLIKLLTRRQISNFKAFVDDNKWYEMNEMKEFVVDMVEDIVRICKEIVVTNY